MTAMPPESDATGTQTLDPFRLIWDVMSSPVTCMVSASVLGVLLSLGTYITQGLTESDLLAQRSFAGTHAILGLGLNDLTSSWLVWLVSLVLVLNIVGLLLRHVWLTPISGRRWQGSAIDHATWTSSHSIAALETSLNEQFGQTTRRSGVVIARKGLWLEGLVTLGVGILALVASLVVDAVDGMEARMGVLGGGVAPSEPATPGLGVKVLEDGDWIERQLPFTARCEETALADPARGWRCDLTRTVPGTAGGPPVTEQAQLQLGPQWPDDAFGLTFHVARERPLPTQVDLVRIVSGAGLDARLVYAGPPRRTAALPGDHTLTAFAGPDGPMAVITPPDGPPYLLEPSIDAHTAPAEVGGAPLSAVSSWWLTLGASRRPGGALMWTGLALLLLGLLILAAVPHVTLTARVADDEVVINVWSFNRLDTVEGLREQLERTAPGAS